MVILIATLCTLWGPGKALRGNDSMHLHDAIQILEVNQQLAMRFFVLGLFSYFVSAMMVGWLFFDRTAAMVVTTILSCFLFILVRQNLVIRRAFITTQSFTSGHIHGNCMRGGASSSYQTNAGMVPPGR